MSYPINSQNNGIANSIFKLNKLENRRLEESLVKLLAEKNLSNNYNTAKVISDNEVLEFCPGYSIPARKIVVQMSTWIWVKNILQSFSDTFWGSSVTTESRLILPDTDLLEEFFKNPEMQSAQQEIVKSSKQGLTITLYLGKKCAKKIKFLRCELPITSVAKNTFLLFYNFKQVGLRIGGSFSSSLHNSFVFNQFRLLSFSLYELDLCVHKIKEVKKKCKFYSDQKSELAVIGRKPTNKDKFEFLNLEDKEKRISKRIDDIGQEIMSAFSLTHLLVRKKGDEDQALHLYWNDWMKELRPKFAENFLNVCESTMSTELFLNFKKAFIEAKEDKFLASKEFFSDGIKKLKAKHLTIQIAETAEDEYIEIFSRIADHFESLCSLDPNR